MESSPAQPQSQQKPRRIQRKRTKGWRMPESAIYVGRPSKWGNPHQVVGPCTVREPFGHEHYCAPNEARGVAVRLYREDLGTGRMPYDADDVRSELAGHDLACWCPLDQPCHADVLLQIANA